MDLKELQSFLKICRKQGVTDITFGDVTVKFGELPRKEADGAEEGVPLSETMTDEQLMFYSAGVDP